MPERKHTPGWFARSVDRFVNAVSPERGNARARARLQREYADHLRDLADMQMSRRRDQLSAGGFASAESSRDQHSWLTSKLSPDSALESDRPAMIERADSALKNYEMAVAHREGRVMRVAGVGMSVDPEVAPDAEAGITEEQAKSLNKKLRTAWERTAECIGRDGQAWWEIQHEMQRDWESRGEWFVLIGDEYDPLAPTTLKVEVIHPDRIATPPGKEGDARVRMGVQLDAKGRAIGYWVRDAHAGDTIDVKETWTYYPKKLANGQFRMVHHFARIERGQHRGFPQMQVGTKRLKNAEEYAAAELERNNIGACMAAFVRTDSAILDEMTSAGVVTDADGVRQRDIVPGMIQYLGPADEVDFSNPQGAPSSFVPFQEYEGRQFAAGAGTAYELLSGDWKSLSWSTGRVLFNIEERTTSVLQKGHAKTFAAIYRNLVTRCVTNGFIDVEQPAYRSAPWLYWAARFIPPPTMAVDPPREDRNDLTLIEAGVKPHSDFVEKKNGMPADVVYARIKRNRELMEEFDINTTMPQMGRDAKQTGGAPTQAGDGNQASSDANSERQATGAEA